MDLDPYKFRKGDLFLFCGYRKHDYELYDMLKKYYNMVMINNPEILTKELVDRIKPKILFFPNWSWKVPKEIVDNYKCICFHEGDLPIGRGGSPIQNHIVRGMYDIKSTAYIMNDRIDAGPILIKRDLNLRGPLDVIFDRIKWNNYYMIRVIIESDDIIPELQDDAKAIYFDRRKPEQSELKNLDMPLESLYDFIRMLADPYPNAFINIGNKKLVFKSAEPFNKILKITGEIHDRIVD